MALLKSVDNEPGIDYYEYRDNNYYNKYEFRMRVKVPGVKYTWWCKKPEDLDKKLAGKYGPYGNVRKEDKQDVIDNLPALKVIAQFQLDRKKVKTLGMRIEGSVVAIFSNDLSELKNLEPKIGSQYQYDYTQVQTAAYAGIKHFVNEPKHKYRVYLRSKRVQDNFHESLGEILNRQKSLYPSPALKKWVNANAKNYGIWYFRWSSSAHFIDYDDESMLSYLALMHGDILGKKYKLEKRPDNI